MLIEFRDNSLFTHIVVGRSRKEFDALIDTGSVKTGIPIEDCQELGLRMSGTERTSGLYGEDYIPLFDATIQIENRQFDIQIAGLPLNIAILGIDLLRYYRININWISNPKIARAEY